MDSLGVAKLGFSAPKGRLQNTPVFIRVLGPNWNELQKPKIDRHGASWGPDWASWVAQKFNPGPPSRKPDSSRVNWERQ